MVVYVVIMLFDEYSMKIDIKKHILTHVLCIYVKFWESRSMKVKCRSRSSAIMTLFWIHI